MCLLIFYKTLQIPGLVSDYQLAQVTLMELGYQASEGG